MNLRFLAIIASLVMLFSLVPTAAFAQKGADATPVVPPAAPTAAAKPAAPVPTAAAKPAAVAQAPAAQPRQAQQAVTIACNDDAAAQAATGVNVQGIGTEDCGWVKRKSPQAEPAVCPVGFVCTLHEGNDPNSGEVVFQVGRGQQVGIIAGTFRQVNGYKPGDAVYNPCQLYANELAWGHSRNPKYDTFYRPGPGDPVCPGALLASGSITIQSVPAAPVVAAPMAPASGPAPVGDTSSAVNNTSQLDQLIKQLMTLLLLQLMQQMQRP